MHSSRAERYKALFSLAILIALSGCGTTPSNSPANGTLGSTQSSIPAPAPGGPLLGYLWSASQQNLYPLLGIAGAAHFGAGVLTDGADIVTAANSGAGSAFWALLLTASGTLDEEQLPAGTRTSVSTRVPLDASIFFSPSGTSAAVVSPSTGMVLIVSGLPASAHIAQAQLPAGSSLDGVAVSDAGTVLTGLTKPGGTGVQVTALSSSAGETTVGTVQAWGGAAFLPGSTAAQAVIADSGSGQVTLLSGIGSASIATASLSTAALLKTPVAVGISPDGRWAFLADSAKEDIVRVGLPGNTAAPSAIACACTPRSLASLTSAGVFALGTDAIGQPLWLLSGGGAAPRAFFVPALVAASSPSSSLTTQAAK